VLTHLPDGSFLSDLRGLPVRIIDAELTVTGVDGSRVRDRYRLITTLLDHDHHPAAELVRLYHERWGATRSRTRLSELPDGRIGLMSTA
jgi:hypothetical protein